MPPLKDYSEYEVAYLVKGEALVIRHVFNI